MDDENEEIRTDLIRDAERGAAIFSEEELSLLQGNQADLKTSLYRDVKGRLRRYRGADPAVRFVYIFRATPDGVIFLADSEPTNSEDISLPGDDYPEGANSPGLQSILKTGLPTTEGPIADSFGTWVTGYALISRDATGNVREVVGIDMRAGDWQTQIFNAGLRTAVFIWALFGLPLLGCFCAPPT